MPASRGANDELFSIHQQSPPRQRYGLPALALQSVPIPTPKPLKHRARTTLSQTPVLSFPHRRHYPLWLCLLASLGTSACLQLNPDYQHRTLGQATNGPDLGRLDSSASLNNTAGQSIPSPTSTSEDNNAQSTTSSEGPSSTLVDSSSSLASSGSSSSSRSSSTTSSTGTSTVPASWHAIEIRGDRLIENLVAGYSLRLTINHQSFVASGAASDGSDLAIVSRRGEVITSLGRELDPQSNWGRSDTKLWFAIDQTVFEGSTSDNEYFLVINDTNAPPNFDSSGIFLGFQDFRDTLPSPSQWAQVRSSEGSNDLSTTIESVLLTASPHISYPLSYASLRKSSMSLPSGIRIDARTQFHQVGLTGDCGRIFPISLTSANNFTLRAGYRSDLNSYAGLSFNNATGVNQVTPINTISPRNNTWDVHSLSWIGTDLGYWRNGTRVLETKSLGSVNRPDQTPLHVELSAGARSVGCVGVGELGLEVDWIRIRRFTYPEPIVRLK